MDGRALTRWEGHGHVTHQRQELTSNKLSSFFWPRVSAALRLVCPNVQCTSTTCHLSGTAIYYLCVMNHETSKLEL